MTQILRSMSRRRGRAALTILGVSIGIFAFVVMGALAEKMNIHATSAQRYYGRCIWVLDNRVYITFGGSLPMSLRKKLQAVDGVRYVSPRIFGPLDYADLRNPLALCAIAGVDLTPGHSPLEGLALARGRMLRRGARGEVVIGCAVARKYDKDVGDFLRVHREKMRIVGVLEPTNTDPDSLVFMSLEDARRVLAMERDEVTAFAVYVEPNEDAEALAEVLVHVAAREGVPVHTISPEEIQRNVGSALSIFNGIVYACTIIAVLVGTLGIANTMVMSVSERAREIGTKKAIGARTSDIFVEFLGEALVIAVVGGAIGLALAVLATWLLNARLAEGGVTLFIITARLVCAAFAVALVAGCIAGIYPALRAARLDPVQALRSV